MHEWKDADVCNSTTHCDPSTLQVSLTTPNVIETHTTQHQAAT